MRCDEFCTEARNDVLRVYDGRSPDENLIDSYSGCDIIDVYFNTREICIFWSSNIYTTKTGFSCQLIIEGMTIFLAIAVSRPVLIIVCVMRKSRCTSLEAHI